MQTKTIRLIRAVTSPTGRGPGNGMYALQRLLREARPPWLKVGGILESGEIPWFWSWEDRAMAAAYAEADMPFVIGPNVLFESSRQPCRHRDEWLICRAKSCLAYVTESQWYADLIDRYRGDNRGAPTCVWPYPIMPIPEGPLPVKWDLLIYAKSGYSLETIRALAAAFPQSVLIEYGRYKRERLLNTARQSRACAYLSDDDRGPLALAEILLAGCPAAGVPRGAPWIDGESGRLVTDMGDTGALVRALESCPTDREAVRAGALARFDGRATLRAIGEGLGAIV